MTMNFFHDYDYDCDYGVPLSNDYDYDNDYAIRGKGDCDYDYDYSHDYSHDYGVHSMHHLDMIKIYP